ncbi:MAG: hypothetical protein IJ781_05090 [Atopobiaceae bacterium]|nr:hypothetical protein [Atopobiaceae bacterium]
MWVTFYATMACAVAFLLVPGYLVARGLRADRWVSIMLAPMVSTALYAVMAILYAKRGVACGWTSLALPVSVAGCALLLAERLAKAKPCAALSVSDELTERMTLPFGIELPAIALALAFALLTGMGLTFFVFVNSLATPDAFVQNYDNAWHLTHITTFMNTSDYSSLSGGFYPSAWHGVVALAGSVTGASSAIAENATNAAFTAVVYPLSCVMLLATLFGDSRRRVLLGALFCMSIAFFPWRIMLYGPMFPNMASFVIMPVVAALFIRLFGNAHGFAEVLPRVLMFLLGGISLALLQPNAIFSCGVFLIPFCMNLCRRHVTERHGLKAGITAELALLLAFVVIWMALVYAPPLHDVVWYKRMAKNDVVESIKWTLALNFVIRRLHFLIGGLVIIGGIVLLLDNERRWLTLSYLLVASIFVVADGVPGIAKNIVAGFWYADYWRLACVVCVFAVPLIAVGVDMLLRTVTWPFCRREVSEGSHSQRTGTRRVAGPVANAVTVVLTVLMLVYNYYPFEFIWWGYRVYAFDTVRHNFVTTYNVDEYEWATLTSDEMAFLEEVQKVVPEGTAVINMPFDGSVFAYSVYDIDVMYRQYAMDPGKVGKELKASINELDSNEEMQKQVREQNIGYLLQLDQGDGKNGVNEDGSVLDLGYRQKEWAGVNAVRDDTPGFTVVLSEGDMRLYRIDAAA